MGNTSSRFNSSDADVTVKSADNVTFRLHRTNIEVQAGAFPSSGVVELSERADVLELLFQFIYPQTHPKLASLDFKTAEALATAAEKYKIYSAMPVADRRLREFLPKHATEILNYAIRFKHVDLINKTALLCARISVYDMLIGLPSDVQMPWALYHQSWEKIFVTAINSLLVPQPNGKQVEIRGVCSNTTSCRKCQFCLISHIHELRNMGSLDELEAALKMSHPPALKCSCSLCIPCRNSSISGKSCINLVAMNKMVEEGIKSMRKRPFSAFLSGASTYPN